MKNVIKNYIFYCIICMIYIYNDNDRLQMDLSDKND